MTKPKMKTMVYKGHLKRVTMPGNPSVIIEAGEEVEVPQSMQLSPLWEEAGGMTTEKKASSKPQ